MCLNAFELTSSCISNNTYKPSIVYNLIELSPLLASLHLDYQNFFTHGLNYQNLEI